MKDDALATYLDALSRDDCYRVDRTLKSDVHETTEVVFFTGKAGGELGPFIRKRINKDTGMGQAYRELWNVQRLGKRFLHLPQIFDVHDRDDELIVIMEFVTGHTLHDEVYERDASLRLAIEFFPKLCDGVIELHEDMPSPIIHRDLKPTNIIVSQNGLSIIDFGIARMYNEDAVSDTTQFGTRAYAPPEQFGYGQTDARSDIYALGMILYYLLREENPTPSIVNSHFRLLEPWPDLQAVVIKATSFDPSYRYQTVRELKEDFLAAADRERYRVKEIREVLIDPLQDKATIQTEDMSEQSLREQSIQQKIKPSEVVGLIWDVLILLLWVFMMVVLILLVISPPETVPAYPTWFLILEYPCFVGCFTTGLAYGVMDKRWLRRHISCMRNQTYGRSWIVAGLFLLAAAIIFCVMTVIVMTTGNLGHS